MSNKEEVARMFDVREMVIEALNTISDEPIGDTALGMGSADIWVKIRGIEYFVRIQTANNSIGVEPASQH